MPVISNALLAAVDKVRSVRGSAVIGWVIADLTIRTRVWSGGRAGLGTPNDTDLMLPQYYTVRQLETREIASSGGLYELGDIMVGPITPPFGTGGFSEAQLAPHPTSDAVEIIYVITGNHAGEYQRVDFRSLNPISYYLVIKRRFPTP